MPEIPATTRAHAVLVALREEIRSGRLPPGTKLRQVELARSLGVSTTPLREAMVTLEREGLLTLDPHKGMVVYRPTFEDLQELYRIRIPLEAQATERAAEFATDEDLAELGEILEQLVHSEDHAEAVRLNSVFHDRIYAAARSPRLASLIADLRRSSRAYLALFTSEPVDIRPHHAEHREIYEALCAHSKKRAARAMTVHLTNSAKVEATLLAHQLDGQPTGT